MNDDFESRLSDGLARRAGHLPRFEGDLDTIRRRGRNRRWATRGLGAVGVLALLGGGVAIATSLQDDASSTVATEDGGDIEVFVPTPTPTPSPTPEPTPQPTPDDDPAATPAEATPNPLDRPSGPDGPDDARILVATGWGVGILNGTGAIFAPDACCTDDELRWFDQPDETRTQGLAGAVAVRDDLRGGYVFASRNALSWTPAAYLSDGLEPLVIDIAGSGVNGELRLWDVGEIDGEVTVLYSTTVTSIGDEQVRSELRTKRLDGTAATTSATVVNAFSSRIDDENAPAWRGAALLPTGQIVELVDRGGCPSISAPGVDPFPSPYPELTDDEVDCPYPSVSSMTVSDDGTKLALVRGDAEDTPELAIYDLAAPGIPLAVVGLEAGKQSQGAWSEIDFAGTKVLVSRGDGMPDDAWASLDEIQVIDIEEGRPQALIYFGSPTFARSIISTLGLPALPPGDPLAFYSSGLAPPPDSETAPPAEPAPPEATPEPSSDPAPAPDRIRNQDRVPVGRDVNVVAADSLVGADGCVGAPLGSVCVGWPFDRASNALDDAFGDGERTDDPATFLEGEPHPADTHVWADATTRVTIVERDGVVADIGVLPESADVSVNLFADDVTIGDVLRALGPPAQVFQAGGEGIEVVVLQYDTDVARVTYEYVEFWGSETRLTDPGGPLEKIPPAYDGLPVNGFAAAAR